MAAGSAATARDADQQHGQRQQHGGRACRRRRDLRSTMALHADQQHRRGQQRHRQRRPTSPARSPPATATTSSAATSTATPRAIWRTCRPACCSPAGSPTMAGRPRPSPCATRPTTRRWPAPTRPTRPATDQRGEARPQPAGTDPDIGAFELNQTGRPAQRDRRHAARRLPARHGRRRPDPRARRRRPAVGPGRRRPAVRRHGLRRAGRQAGHRPDDRRRRRRPVPVPPRRRRSGGRPGLRRDPRLLRAPSTTRSTCARSTPDPAADGNQAFSFIGDDAFTHAGQLRYEATADGDFLVSGNIDRDLDADFAFVVRTGVEQLRRATSCCRGLLLAAARQSAP